MKLKSLPYCLMALFSLGTVAVMTPSCGDKAEEEHADDHEHAEGDEEHADGDGDGDGH